MSKLNNLKLNIAKRLVYSFTVNVRKHPEFVKPLRADGTGQYCDRNTKVAQAAVAIGELQRSL